MAEPLPSGEDESPLLSLSLDELQVPNTEVHIVYYRLLANSKSMVLEKDSVLEEPKPLEDNAALNFDNAVEDLLWAFKLRGSGHCFMGVSIASPKYCARGHVRDNKYYVFNPTTKQFAIIPSVPGDDGARKSIRFMGLVFHQTTCPRFKVVCILGGAGVFVIQIYYSETGKWKTANSSFSEEYYMFFGNGVYWNEAIHWNPFGRNPLYFDLKSEQLKTLPLPLPVQLYLPKYFGESRGHLHMVKTTIHESLVHLTVYEMIGDHAGWVVKYRVDDDDLNCYPGMIRSFPYYHYCGFKVIDIIRGEKEEDTFLLLKFGRAIIRYDVLEKSFKWLTNMTTNFEVGRYWRREIHPYIQCLTSF